jgi:5-amino-6-(5-phosphoribosylamino)uracil reductase
VIVMASRPYVLLSVATSLDGFIADTGAGRLLLSGSEDLDRVDEVRASVDAILVGANTVRTDDPRLLVRSPQRRRRRTDAGRAPNPIKVTLTRSGDLDPEASFFTAGHTEKVVYATGEAVPALSDRLATAASVVDAGTPPSLDTMLADLAGRGVERLLVEGGQQIHTAFLTGRLVDELHLVIAPFFVGTAGAARFVGDGTFPHDANHRMTLVETRPVGDCVLLRYLARSDGR